MYLIHVFQTPASAQQYPGRVPEHEARIVEDETWLAAVEANGLTGLAERLCAEAAADGVPRYYHHTKLDVTLPADLTLAPHEAGRLNQTVKPADVESAPWAALRFVTVLPND